MGGKEGAYADQKGSADPTMTYNGLAANGNGYANGNGHTAAAVDTSRV